jgi:hypothetical protein
LGGVGNHLSIEDLMIKIGNWVHRTAQMALHEQMFASHGEQMARGNGQGGKFLQETMIIIDTAAKDFQSHEG